jgi:hypothetical protein
MVFSFFWDFCTSLLNQVEHTWLKSQVVACRSSLENIGKISLIPVFNKTSSRAHTESELDVLGVHGKLVKYVVYSSKRKKLKKNYFSSHKLPKQQSTNFWSQGILGAKTHFEQNFTTSSYKVRV